MKAWVILDINDEPIGVRESEQSLLEAAEQIAKQSILTNDERTPAHAEGLIIVPTFTGDSALIKVYLAGEREFPYMAIRARKFDSTLPIEEW